jgi:hypothetical protein
MALAEEIMFASRVAEPCVRLRSELLEAAHELAPMCRWEVVEAGAGAPILYGASLPLGFTGPQVLSPSAPPPSFSHMDTRMTYVTWVESQSSNLNGCCCKSGCHVASGKRQNVPATF